MHKISVCLQFCCGDNTCVRTMMLVLLGGSKHGLCRYCKTAGVRSPNCRAWAIDQLPTMTIPRRKKTREMRQITHN
jgi:hypothetical protein